MRALGRAHSRDKALVELGERYNIDLPICRAVYSVLYLGADVKEEMDALFARSLKYEFGE